MCSFTVWPNPFFDMCNFLQPRLCWKRSFQGFKTWFQKSLGDIIYIATSSVTVGPVQNLFGTFIVSESGWQGHQTERDAQTSLSQANPSSSSRSTQRCYQSNQDIYLPSRSWVCPRAPFQEEVFGAPNPGGTLEASWSDTQNTTTGSCFFRQ